LLNNLTLKNFKALREIQIDFGRITIFIGPNSSGKSSALQALTLLKQSRGQSQLVTSGNLSNLGNYSDVAHRYTRDKQIEYRISGTVPEPSMGYARLEYEVRFDQNGMVRSQHLGVDSPAFTVNGQWNSLGNSSIEPEPIRVFRSTVNMVPQRIVTEPIRINSLTFDQDADEVDRERAQTVLRAIFSGIADLLSRVYVVPALRGFDKPVYPLQDSSVTDFFTSSSPDHHAASVLSTILYRRELEEAISRFSSRALGVRLGVRAVPPKQVAAEAQSDNGSRINLVNEGFGANQLIGLLAQLVVSPPDSIVCIEEPEIHLHPRAQSALAGVFSEFVADGARRIVLTTHSEHILMGLLTEVAQGRLEAGQLRVYYMQKDTTGVAHAELLEVDELGRLSGGMKGFFEANIDELENYLKALSQENTPRKTKR